ncbi:hypothetical protein A2856_01635 [Candidatus Uhrbacteria bacterium RIFCSPHIGHO2_01_FULL_63_20]|uniref:FecR protein domain-containing protein n=1 Tax=Candidatus Uhrbacteria bacterium RIFCSPHIGHO2_01_FULL_63_20 TaxID=1802385 RepID=A0A1F7TK88_9BACT|nr:MAG: hypothetical protein A2856_01635 [Candidatus Uhrbacteria bacterium RIFCSPHIGHO2_01_FULL_63_20]
MDLLPKDLPLLIAEDPHERHHHGNAPRLLPFILGALVVLVAAFVLATQHGLASSGEIAYAGEGAQRYAEGTGWVDAEEGDKVISGTRLRTRGGRVSVSVGDGSALRLDAESEVTVVALARDRLLVELEGGRAYSRVEAGSGWEVKALGASVKALGTAFSVSADEARNRVGVDVLSGTVKLTARAADAAVEREVAEGQFLAVDLDKPALTALAQAPIKPADAKKDPFLGWNIEEDGKMGSLFAIFDPTAPVAQAAPTAIPVAPKPSVKPAASITKTTTTAKATTVTKVNPVSSELRLTAVPTPDGINLQWTKSSTAGFQGYKVVRSEDNPDPYYPGDGYIRFATDRSNTAYLDTGAVRGKTYHYRVCRLAADAPVSCGNVVNVTF